MKRREGVQQCVEICRDDFSRVQTGPRDRALGTKMVQGEPVPWGRWIPRNGRAVSLTADDYFQALAAVAAK